MTLIDNVREVAKYLQVGERTVYRYMKDDSFPQPILKTVDGKIFRAWKMEDLDNYINKLNKNVEQKKRGRPLKNYS